MLPSFSFIKINYSEIISTCDQESFFKFQNICFNISNARKVSLVDSDNSVRITFYQFTALSEIPEADSGYPNC